MAGNSRITEKFEYKTNILTSYDGHEQRIKTRQIPRHSLSYDYDAMTTFQAQWLKGMTRIRQTDKYYIPMWHKVVYLNEDFVEHGKALYINTDYMYNLEGCEWIEVFVRDDPLQTGINLVRRIDHFTNNAIILKKQIDRPMYKENCWIYPLIECSIAPQDNLQYVFANGAGLTMNFEDLLNEPRIHVPNNYRYEYDEGYYWWQLRDSIVKKEKLTTEYLKIRFPELYKEAINKGQNPEDYIMKSFGGKKVYRDWEHFNRYNLPATYNGYEILWHEPWWIDDDASSLSIEKNTNRLDNETGNFVYDLKNSNSYDTIAFETYMGNVKMVNNMIKFFNRMGGMFKAFYCPTWVNDFTPKWGIQFGKNTIYTELTVTYKMYATNTRKKSIVVFTKDYQSYIFDVAAYATEEIDGKWYGKIVLAKDSNITIPVERIEMISYLDLVRFSDDALTLNYEANDVANVTLSMKEVDDIN